MKQIDSIEKVNSAVKFLQSKTKLQPKIGLVLGSGLGSFVSSIQVEQTIPFDAIPNFGRATVDGHKGQFVFGTLNGVPLAILQGRLHYYEGHSMQDVVFPIRIFAGLGIQNLVLTNSAGGLNPQMSPGDFMVVEDHINLMGINPLVGQNVKDWGPRFPDMTEAYNKELREKLEQSLVKNKVRFFKGVYCAVSGPSYETPAEVRYLHQIGGSAVGMSTAPEAIVGNHMGLKVCCLSCITNKAAGLSQHQLSHEEVTDTTKKVESVFTKVLTDFIAVI